MLRHGRLRGGGKLTTFGSKSDGITQFMKSEVNFLSEKRHKSVHFDDIFHTFSSKFHGITQFTKSEIKFCLKKAKKVYFLMSFFSNFLRNLHNL